MHAAPRIDIEYVVCFSRMDEVTSTNSTAHSEQLGLFTGIGFVVASMIGTGIFLSTGFMVSTLDPWIILVSWLFGSILAFCGTVTYASLASQIDRSGGEYKYIVERIHPSLGFLVGYGSVILGFACPIAIDALAAAAFLEAVFPTFGIQMVG